jgi:heme exporter protein D
MRYVTAGYAFILVVLALYAVQLVWRRRRLSQAVDRVAGPFDQDRVAGPVAATAAGPQTEASA